MCNTKEKKLVKAPEGVFSSSKTSDSWTLKQSLLSIPV